MTRFAHYSPPFGREMTVGRCRSDVYSLGVILFELLTGERPFRGSQRMLLHQVINDDAPSPRKLNSNIPRDLETICLKCLEKEPRRRYASAHELAQDLGRWTAGEPITARPAGKVERAVKWSRRRPASAALLIVSVAATLVVLAGSLLFTAINKVQRDRAVAAERAKEQALYLAHVKLADHYLEAGQIGLVRDLLRLHPSTDPDGSRRWEWDYLWSAISGLTTWKGHDSVVESLAWSPTGEHFASAGEDGVVRIWPAHGGGTAMDLRAHVGRVWAVRWAADGSRIASAGEDGTVRIWDARSGETLHVFRGHQGAVRSVAWNADNQLSSGGDDRIVRTWDPESGKEIHALDGHTTTIRAVAWSPDGHKLASVSDGNSPIKRAGELLLWDIETGKQPRELVGHTASITAVAWSPDGSRLASAGNGHDDVIRIWDTSTGTEVLRLPHELDVFVLAWSRDGRRLVSAGRAQMIVMWEIPSGRMLRRWRQLGEQVAWSDDGERLVSGNWNGNLHLWNTLPRDETRRFLVKKKRHGDPGGGGGLDWSPDGRLLAGAAYGSVVTFDIETGSEVTIYKNLGSTTCIAWSSNGQFLAVADSSNGAVHIWNRRTGRTERTLTGASAWQVAWSPNGSKFAATLGGQLKVWDANTWKEIQVLNARGKLAWHPDGRRIAATQGLGDNKIAVWDVETGRKVLVFEGHSGFPRNIAWSPNGRLLAAGGMFNDILLWEDTTGKLVRKLRGHSQAVYWLAWSPDGRRIASGGSDKVVRIWDPSSGYELLSLRGHSSLIYTVAWSPDGRQLASKEQHTPGYLRVWGARFQSGRTSSTE